VAPHDNAVAHFLHGCPAVAVAAVRGHRPRRGGAHAVSYTSDAGGNVTARTDATGSSSYAHDPFGELTTATSGAGQTIGYGYDADGNTNAITYPLGSLVEWSSRNLLAVDAADGEHAQLVADFLTEREKAGHLIYDTGRS